MAMSAASPQATPPTTVYYEWFAAEQKWVKIKDSDPDPPQDLEPGKFDGQISESHVNK